MKVFVTRHGETDMNARLIACGAGEAMLTEKGKAQGRELARLLAEKQDENRIRHIFVSPLKRARDTASFIEKALGITAVVEPRIHEVFFGDCEGKPLCDEEFLLCKGEPFLHFPHGESLVTAAARTYPFLDELREMRLEGNVLLVCHGMEMKVIASYFRSMTMEEWLRVHYGNCQVQVFSLP